MYAEDIFTLLGTGMILYLLSLLVISAIFCGFAASHRKGYTPFAWFVLGLLYGPLALLALIAVLIADKNSEGGDSPAKDSRLTDTST